MQVKFAERRGDIGLPRRIADLANQSADPMLCGSDCSGPSAAICQTLKSLGAAKQRMMTLEYENRVDRDNGEISRLEGEEIVAHQRRSTSYGDALDQITTGHPPTTIHEAGDAKAEEKRA